MLACMFTMQCLDFAQAQQLMRQNGAPTAYQALPWQQALQHTAGHLGRWWCIYAGNHACAVFFLGYKRRFGLWPQVYFNRSGNNLCDIVTGEYNQMWLSAYAQQHNMAAALRQALPALIKQHYGGLCMVKLDYILAAHATDYAACGWRTQIFKQLPTWGIPLSAQTDGLAAASSTLKRQLRRSYTQLHSSGGMAVEAATTPTQARDWLNALFMLNNLRHNDGAALPSHETFLRFHYTLLAQGVPNIDYDVLKITHQQQTMGYVYHLLQPQQALYYMGGFNYNNFGTHKVGLLCHMLAAQHHAAAGRTWYDFLAGDYRYKRQMGSEGEPMVGMALYAPRWRVALWHCALQVRAWWRGRA